jgi:predicted RNase H-like nuclease (RuvC/YqgF family)
MKKIDQQIWDRGWRILLRVIPILPAPELYDLLAYVKRSQNSVETQVNDAIESIRKTSALVTQLEAGLKERASKLEELKQEHLRYSQLAEIEASKAQALLSQIESTLGSRVAKERWVAFAINIAAGLILFILGIALSDPIRHLWTNLRAAS